MYFMFPLDFFKIFSAITVFDLICIYYLLKLPFYSGVIRVPLEFYPVASLLFIFAFAIALSGLFTFYEPTESIKAVVVVLFILIKCFIVAVYFLRMGEDCCLKQVSLIFFISNIFLVILLVLGIGVSGSGRFSGFLGNSNGLAEFAVFSLICASTISKTFFSRCFYYMHVITSLVLMFASVSKGALVFTCIIAFYFMLKKYPKRSVLGFSIFIILLSLGLLDIVHYLISLFDYLSSVFPNTPFDRISEFISLLSESGFSNDLDESRSNLNNEVLALLSQDFRFFGYGFESSIFYTSEGLRPHNVILTTALEIGALGLLLIFVYYSFIAYFLFVSNSRCRVEMFYAFSGLAIILFSMKTPFFIQKGMPWFILMLIILKLRRS